MDRYARQRGLVSQDIVADADIAIFGTGAPLSYLLQCLAMVGAGTRHGRIRLCFDDRPVGPADLGDQFLLQPEDIGAPLAAALADRVSRVNAAVSIDVADGPAGRGVAVAVPGAAELAALADKAAHLPIAAWGQVLPTSVYVGPVPLRTGADDQPTILTASLAAMCGGLLAQTILSQLGAIIDGPAVVSSWLEERQWISYPGIGKLAGAAVAGGTPTPALGGVLERADSPGIAMQFQILAAGEPVDPLVTAIIDDDNVVVSVPVPSHATYAVVRPRLAPPRPVRPLLWSPIDGTVLRDDHVVGGNPLPDRLPPFRLVVCGAGALGNWATAAIAASRLPDGQMCLVDMDDTVEAHNLNRQVLFDPADVGQPKAQLAAGRLRKIHPGMRTEPVQVMISPELVDELTGSAVHYEVTGEPLQNELALYRRRLDTLAGELRQATAILSCPDNHLTRWSLNVIAERLKIPLVNGAVDGFIGRVHVCDPGDKGRCLVCWLGTSVAVEPERQSCTDAYGLAPVPSLVTSAAIVGAAQAATLIAVLAGQSHRVGRFHVFDGTAGVLDGYRAADRDPGECPAHLFDPAA